MQETGEIKLIDTSNGNAVVWSMPYTGTSGSGDIPFTSLGISLTANHVYQLLAYPDYPETNVVSDEYFALMSPSSYPYGNADLSVTTGVFPTQTYYDSLAWASFTNIHTTDASSVTPEPSTLVGSMGGVLVVAASAWRRRRTTGV